MHDTQQERDNWKAWMMGKIAESMALEARFRRLFGESDAMYDARRQRELAIDGELAAIPATHRLAIARQMLLALDEHGLIDHDRNDMDTHFRALAVRLGVPFVELWLSSSASAVNPETRRDDLDDWVEWCREHAPERLPKNGGA